MAKRVKREQMPATFAHAVEAGGHWLHIGGPYTSLPDADDAMALRIVQGERRPVRILCVETGRYLEDFDGANGRSYLTARRPDGQPVRSKRYADEDERNEALDVMQWAMRDEKLASSEFDPRKLAGPVEVVPDAFADLPAAAHPAAPIPQAGDRQGAEDFARGLVGMLQRM